MVSNFSVMQNEYKPDILPIQNDVENPVGKIGILEYKNINGNESLKEIVHYNKYLKYKTKYIALKNK